MLEKLRGMIAKNIVKILMLGSLVIYVICSMIVTIYDIPTYNSKEGIIMLDAIVVPLLMGLWIHSNRMKNKKKRTSIFTKCVVICVFCIIMSGNIWLL